MDKKTIETIMSTGKDDYGTPQWLFDRLNDIFNFDIDVCASDWNYKVKKYFSEKNNSFRKKWRGNCFMNPPYSKAQSKCLPDCSKTVCNRRGYHLVDDKPGLFDWVDRAHRQSEQYKSAIACLLPARTDTKWFEIVFKHSFCICFIPGRLKFLVKGGISKFCAPFPSCIVVFNGNSKIDRSRILNGLKRIGHVAKIEKP
jgi:site-specific DNA-methyltransferase (adenine-specific)